MSHSTQSTSIPISTAAPLFSQMAAAICVVFLLAMPAHATDVVSNMKSYLAAWNAHDADKAASFLVEDVTFFDASVGTPLKGRENAKKNVIESFINAVPDSKWESIGDPIVNGETVAFEWQYSGTNTGDWADGTSATGKTFEFKGMSVFRFKEDKLVYQGDYYDALGFFKQLGLM